MKQVWLSKCWLLFESLEPWITYLHLDEPMRLMIVVFRKLWSEIVLSMISMTNDARLAPDSDTGRE